MTYEEIEAARKAAQQTIDMVSASVAPMIRMSVGHLRAAGLRWDTVDALRSLKRELRDFDIRTGRWK